MQQCKWTQGPPFSGIVPSWQVGHQHERMLPWGRSWRSWNRTVGCRLSTRRPAFLFEQCRGGAVLAVMWWCSTVDYLVDLVVAIMVLLGRPLGSPSGQDPSHSRPPVSQPSARQRPSPAS